jgi:DNA-binding transcriptional LysR family regulator
MELRQLEYFCAVSSLENFTKAAHFLHVSQPSVTKAIQALEAELNLLLFDRSQKHVMLTEAGQIFFLHAKKILQDVQTAQLSVEKFKNPNGGVLKFGMPPMVESYIFPNFFMKFQAANPNIFLDLQECNDSYDVNAKLDSDFLDFGIVFLRLGERLNNSLKLFNSEYYLCVPPNHKLANEEKISFDELKDEKFIVQPNGTVQNFITMKRSADAGFVPDVLLNTSQLKTIKELVSGGVAVSMLPKFVITDSTKFKSVPIDPPVKFKIVLAWNSFKELSPPGTKFLDFFNDFLQSQEVTS